jgi:hypothetical protein
VIGRFLRELGPSNQETIAAMTTMCSFCTEQGKLVHGMDLAMQVLVMSERTLGSDHFFTAHIMGNVPDICGAIASERG